MEIVLYTAISADGFISDESGNNYWIDSDYKGRLKELAYNVKQVIVGHNTYKEFLSDNTFDTSKVIYNVLTGSPDSENPLQQRTPEDLVASIQAKEANQALLIGGSETNTIFYKRQLIDKIVLHIHPVFLGGGLRLFSDDLYRKDLRLEDVGRFSQDYQIIQAIYKPRY